MKDHRYQQLIEMLPDDIVKKLIVPLANKYPEKHLSVMAFIAVLDDVGYCITKKETGA